MFGRACFNRIEPLETRCLFAAEHAVGINFNDEALWDTNFSTAVAQAKSLGVTSVRVWIGFNSYDDRPNAWDIVPPFGAVSAGTADPNDPNIGSPAVSMRRIFALKRAGFSVLLITNSNSGTPPTSDAQVTGWIRHLMDATETPTSKQTLADVVDYWEIGNEPDSGGYWSPSTASKLGGLRSYVDHFLIPAAEELKSGPKPEKVVSAGVSASPADLKTILDELNAQNAMADIDYVGFHPYAAYDPTNPAAGNPVLDHTLLAKSYAAVYGKPLMATEWNVRGFGTAGAYDATWAQAIDYEYRNVIEPNYAVAFYFALANNWAYRGGTTSARPGSVLKHDTTLKVTPSSPMADLAAYLNAPLIPAEPFYSTFNSWQMASVSGTVANTSGAPTPTTTVYLDANGNNLFDTGEYSTTTAADGTYKLNYSTSKISWGKHLIRILTPASMLPKVAWTFADLEPLGALTNVNFSISPVTPPVSTIGYVTGKLFGDTDADKVLDAAETYLVGWPVFLDLDGNGVMDSTDPQAVTTAGGAFSIAYDTSKAIAKTARLLASKTSDYYTSTPIPTLNLTAGTTQSGFLIGIYKPPGSISGFLWNDSDGDGVVDTNETRTGSRVVFLDANKNGKLDTGETQVTSDAAGNYTFAGLAAGTYYVSRVFPAGYHLSNSTNSYVTVKVAAGMVTAGVNIGTTDKTVTVVTPPIVDTPPVVTPPPVVVTPPPISGTASISGSLFAQASKWTADMVAAPWTIFLDTNNNGVLDTGEISAAMKSNTTFALTGLAAGTYTVALKDPVNWATITPGSKTFTIALKDGQAKTGQNFVVQKTA